MIFGQATANLSEPTAAERALDELLAADATATQASWHRLDSGLRARGILLGDGPFPTSLKPHILPAVLLSRWSREVEATLDTAERLGRVLLAERYLYEKLHLPLAARDLIEIDPGYERIAVIARPDLVWRGDRLALLELNTDSPALMTFSDLIEDLLRELFPLQRITESFDLRSERRTERLLEALLECYSEFGGKNDPPTIAVVDWSDAPMIHERRALAATFERAGAGAVLADPRELSFGGGRLSAGGRKIDLVYRGISFLDFLSRSDETSTLLRAYREGAVCMVNPLRSFLFETKGVLSLIRDGWARGMSVAARDMIQTIIPETRQVDERLRSRLYHQRHAWVLKKATSHSGKDVFIGPATERDDWDAALSATKKELWVAQAVQAIPMCYLPVPGTNEMKRFYLNWNPFLFGGRHGGSSTRASTSLRVSVTSEQGVLLPALILHS